MCCIFPIAKILFLISLRRCSISLVVDTTVLASSSSSGPLLSSSSSEQTASTARSMSVILDPTKGKDHVKASIKLGSQ